MATERPKKLQRISQACDLCHRRSIRCRPSAENPQQKCQNCYDFDVACTYSRPSRRRRNPSTAQPSPPNAVPNQQSNTQLASPNSDGSSSKPESLQAAVSAHSSGGPTAQPEPRGALGHVRDGQRSDTISVAWHSFALASADTIEHYTHVFMDIIQPIFPLFHEPTLRERIHKRHYLLDSGFFTSVMAACALVAARLRDGALGDRCAYQDDPQKASETFFAAAEETIPKNLNQARGLDFMRACGLLALCGIQYGRIPDLHRYLGTYLTLSAMQEFHDERNWPAELSTVDVQERRRVFWSMYSLDIYTSAVFDGIIRSQEVHSNVQYPNEINDEGVTPGMLPSKDDSNWMRGWNFATDLFRVLEHSMRHLRKNREAHVDRVSVARLMIVDGITDQQVANNITSLYDQLPPRFKNYHVRLTGDRSEDYFGFQAAYIQTTLQLVRMTLLSSGGVHDINYKCNVAEEALNSFQAIAPEFLRAINTPLIFHLGGIGRILASVMEGVLGEDSYQRVRRLLVCMADLLQTLESSLHPTDGASRDLRNQIARIDEYMSTQRRLMSSMSQQHMQQPMDAMPNAPIPPPPAQMPMMNGMGMQDASEDFQLPSHLVNGAAWPWPFEFSTDNQLPMGMGMGMGYQ